MSEALGRNSAGQRTPRQSISFPSELHEALADIARRNNVSIGWVVRYACEGFVASHPVGQLLPDVDNTREGPE